MGSLTHRPRDPDWYESVPLMAIHATQDDASSDLSVQKTLPFSSTTWKLSRRTICFVCAGVLCTVALAVTLGLCVGRDLHRSASKSASNIARGSLPSYPLAVKSPYLAAWLSGEEIRDAATAQPQFWNGVPLTWPILARVNGSVFSLFNDKNVTAATTTGVSYTASHTYVYMTVPDADFVLDFFTPVLPGENDYARQSLPYSYLTISAKSSSTQRPVNVQILNAIDYTWTGQHGQSQLDFTTSGDAAFWRFNNPNAIPYTEHDQMAAYGSVVLGTKLDTNTSSACGTPESITNAFKSQGVLKSKSGPCSGKDLAALSRDLGLVGSTAHNVTFTIGFDREQAISFLNTTDYTGYYRTKWPTIPQAVQFVLQDYTQVLRESTAFDSEIHSRAKSLSGTWGDKYAAIIDASVRQAFGSIELVIPATDVTKAISSNATITTPPVAFIKEISTNGNINTVDYQSHVWPMFICLNPSYIRFLLEPMLIYLSTGGWPHPWVIHDLGKHYPNATGHNDGLAEQMPNFETSTLFTLLHAYLKYTGDAAFTQKYMPILKGYAEWLAVNSLYPDRQLMNMDHIRPTANQTLLAVMSTIGLKAAYHVTANITYSRIAEANVDALYTNGLGLDGSTPSTSSHFTWNYGRPESWGVLYPSFADVVLGLNTFPVEAWTMQSSWYLKQMTTAGLPFARVRGPVFTWGSGDVNIMAASVSSPALQERVVSSTYDFLNNGLNQNKPFGAWYYVSGKSARKWKVGKAKATVGGNFALMAVQQGYWYKGWSNTSIGNNTIAARSPRGIP